MLEYAQVGSDNTHIMPDPEPAVPIDNSDLVDRPGAVRRRSPGYW